MPYFFLVGILDVMAKQAMPGFQNSFVHLFFSIV